MGVQDSSIKINNELRRKLLKDKIINSYFLQMKKARRKTYLSYNQRQKVSIFVNELNAAIEYSSGNPNNQNYEPNPEMSWYDNTYNYLYYLNEDWAVRLLKWMDKECFLFENKYHSLSFYQQFQLENEPKCLLDTENEIEEDEFDYAIGGFYTIYEDEQILPFKKNKRSRTGCGISHDGKFLYLMVTTPDFHLRDRNGLNYEECALIFRNLGCTKAMQFDGGHSSAMIVNGKAVETPFLQRKVPTALSISIK